MNKTIKIVAAFLLLAFSSAHPSHSAVSNVEASQREDSRVVDIVYDLAQKADISLEVRTPETEWEEVYAVDGDVGTGVPAGTGRSIVWRAGDEWRSTQFPQIQVRVGAQVAGTMHQPYTLSGRVTFRGYNWHDVEITVAQQGGACLTTVTAWDGSWEVEGVIGPARVTPQHPQVSRVYDPPFYDVTEAGTDIDFAAEVGESDSDPCASDMIIDFTDLGPAVRAALGIDEAAPVTREMARQVTELPDSLTRGAGVSDLIGAGALENLRQLDLRDNPNLIDLSPLASLNLESVRLAGTGSEDLTPLSGMTNLKTVDLRNTPVSDLTPLRDLENVEKIDLSQTQVTSIDPLHRMYDLREISLASSPANDIRFLRLRETIESLDLRDTPELDWCDYSETWEVVDQLREREATVYHDEDPCDGPYAIRGFVWRDDGSTQTLRVELHFSGSERDWDQLVHTRSMWTQWVEGPVTIRAYAPLAQFWRFDPETITVEQPVALVEFTARQSNTVLEGYVITDGNQPLRGVEVILSPVGTGETVTAITDWNGFFSYEFADEATAEISATVPGYALSPSSFTRTTPASVQFVAEALD